MNKYHNNFYFKALIKTFKIHKRLNDADLRKVINVFGKKDDNGFYLPHLLFSSVSLLYTFDLIDTYCNLIGHQYAKDVALYHMRKIQKGEGLGSSDLKYTTQQFKRLLKGDKNMFECFLDAIKKYQIKKWINRNMHCNHYLDDKGFYDVIYGNKC